MEPHDSRFQTGFRVLEKCDACLRFFALAQLRESRGKFLCVNCAPDLFQESANKDKEAQDRDAQRAWAIHITKMVESDPQLKGKNPATLRFQLREDDQFDLIEITHEGRSYCVIRTVPSRKVGGILMPDWRNHVEPQEMPRPAPNPEAVQRERHASNDSTLRDNGVIRPFGNWWGGLCMNDREKSAWILFAVAACGLLLVSYLWVTAKPTVVEKRVEVPVERKSTQRRILILDDSTSNVCKVITSFLESEGYAVITTDEGREALEMMSAQPADALFVIF